MNDIIAGYITALWLGILTSMSPCPLATNVAAVSYLAKKVEHKKAVFWSGIAYTLGRALAYALLGAAIIYSIVSIPAAAAFLRRYMNMILGPALLFTGLCLLDVIKLKISGSGVSDARQKDLARSPLRGAFILGLLFALSFCPVSAAIYFGSLIPLALKFKFGATLPIVYGIGTALPVMIFAIIISFGVTSVSKWFGHVTRIEVYARKITGAVFVIVGLYYIGAYIFPK